MKKGYWVAKANVIDGDKQGAYGKLATKEGAEFMRNVVVEFPSFEIALQAYESDDYQQALAVLDGGAERAYAIVEGYE
jgi:uncharacterized protein (DUF1330 family)